MALKIILLLLSISGLLKWLFPTISHLYSFAIVLLLVLADNLSIFLIYKSNFHLKVNLVGGIFPLLYSLHLVIQNNCFPQTMIVTIFISLLCIKELKILHSGTVLHLTRLLTGSGILILSLHYLAINFQELPTQIHYLLPYEGQHLPIISFFACSWGVFIGADLISLPLHIGIEHLTNTYFKIAKQRNRISALTIGGAGVHDGIFLNSIVNGTLFYICYKLTIL